MKIIGLTGGIASGKSTVASILQKLGAHIFDADIASRQAVARGSQGLQQVVDVFGRDYPVSYTHLTLPTICSV